MQNFSLISKNCQVVGSSNLNTEKKNVTAKKSGLQSVRTPTLFIRINLKFDILCLNHLPTGYKQNIVIWGK